MKSGLTWIVAIIDKSGSMWNLTKDTIGSFNSFVEEQKTKPGKAKIIRTLFDDTFEIGKLENIKKATLLDEKNYVTGGCTALYDAVGSTIDHVGQKLNSMKEDEKPESVIFHIITDGWENASKEYTQSRVKEMIEHQTNKYNWVFTFIGGNIDVKEVSKGMGISASNSLNYNVNSKGTSQAYSAMSCATSSLRSGNFESVDKSAESILCSADSELSSISKDD